MYSRALFFFLLLNVQFSLANWGTDDVDTSYLTEDPQVTPNQNVSEFPGESLDMYQRSLRFRATDFSIPGPNGLDLTFSRYYDQGGALFEAKGIERYESIGMPFNWNVGSKGYISLRGSGNDYGCLGDGGSAVFYATNGEQLHSYGYESSSSLPSGTVAAFRDGSLFTCDSSGTPILSRPNGHQLVFEKNARVISGFRHWLLDRIVDRFGNYIIYNYDTNGQLTSMVRNDSARIDIQWSSTTGLIEFVKSKSKTVSFSLVDGSTVSGVHVIGYNDNSDFIVTNQEGQKTVFTLANDFGRELRQIRFPSGLVAKYEYRPKYHNSYSQQPGPYDPPHYYWLKVSKRILEDIDGTTRETDFGPSKYELSAKTDRDQYAHNSVIEYFPSLNKTVEHKYEFFDTLSNKTHFEAGWAQLNGSLVRYKVIVNGNVIYAIDQEWERHGGDYGCVNGTEIHARVKSCKRWLPEKITKTLFDGGSSTSYVTEYTEYNTYGDPVKWQETGSSTKYFWQSYNNSVSTWNIGRPNTLQYSTNGQTWLQKNRYTYHSVTGTYKGVLNKVYEYGLEVSANTQYHATGDLKKIEYPGADYDLFESYKNGVYRTHKKPKRYTSGVNTSTREVDDFGNITMQKDFDGIQTHFDFDKLNRLTKRYSGDQYWDESTITYTTATTSDVNLSGVYTGQLKQVETHGDYVKTTFYDGFYRPSLVKENGATSGGTNWRYKNFKYNVSDQLIFESAWSNSTTETDGFAYSFDALGRVTNVKEKPSGIETKTEYLANSKIKVTDPKNHVTQTTYRTFGSPSYNLPTLIDSPESVDTKFEYSVFDNVTKISQGNGRNFKHHTFDYDSYQRLCKTYVPEVGFTSIQYGSNHQVSWRAVKSSSSAGCDYTNIPESTKISYTYDNQNSLKNISFGDSTPTRLSEYTAGARLYKVNQGGQNWTYVYNTQGALKKQTFTIDGKSFELEFGHGSQGYINRIDYPSGKSINIKTDAYGRAFEVGSYVTDVSYHHNDMVDTITYGNGTTYTTTLDSRYKPRRMTVRAASNTVLSDHTYSYDNSSNVQTITDHLNTQFSIDNMTYDGLNRLETADGFWGAGNFTYDKWSNIKTKSLGSDALTLHYNGFNKLTSISGSQNRSFSYDNLGNITSNGLRNFSYNLAGQMKSSDGISYEYDGHNKRTKKTINGKTEYSLYSLDGTLFYQQESNGNHIDYIYLNNKLISTVKSK